MRKLGLVVVSCMILGGCVSSGPSDADQQKLAKDWSAENVAQAYEKAGKQKEADEVRRNARSQQQGQEQGQ